jgi:hypothetical protein
MRITARREHFTDAPIVDLNLRIVLCGFFNRAENIVAARRPRNWGFP